MSRIGKMPIPVPAGVTVTIGAGNEVTVKGPNGTLSRTLHADMIIKNENNEIIVVDKIELPEIKTKYVQQILNNFKLDKKVLLVLPEYNEVLLRAGRNIEKLSISTVELVSLYEVVSNATILMTSEAIKNMEEAFAE